jgi:hypothetical protein
MAGPVLIALGVAVLLHRYLFAGQVSTQAGDPLNAFLPAQCFLGRTLGEGTIPVWNPHMMTGIRFAGGPGTRWMDLPAMALSLLAPCGDALRLYTVLLPALAGLGGYAFLRAEGVGRPGATLAGLTLALPVASSSLVLSLPFAGTIAWTAVLLAAEARAFRSDRWSGRVGWSIGAGVAWTQVAAAHITNGLLIGSVVAVAYGVARGTSNLRAGRRTRREVLGTMALLVGAAGGLGAAILLPVLAYLPRTTVGLGFRTLTELSRELTGTSPVLAFREGRPVGWLLRHALAPGLYLGMVGLVLMPVALADRARRGVVLALGAVAAAFFVLSLEGVASALRPLAGDGVLTGTYLHDPTRMTHGVYLLLPLLAGFGLDAWPRRTGRGRFAAVAGGAAVWLVLPAALGASPAHLAVPLGGLVVGGGALLLWGAARAPAVVVPGVVAIELLVAGLLPSEYGRGATGDVNPVRRLGGPYVDVAEFRTPSPFTSALRRSEGRYASVDPRRWTASGYRGHLSPGLLASQQAMIFGLEEAQGYWSVQNPRFWSLVRRADPKVAGFNQSFLASTPDGALDLLGVTHVVHGGRVRPPDTELVARHARWSLLRRSGVPPRAAAYPSWAVVEEEEALERSIAGGVAATEAVPIEADPELDPAPGRREAVPGRFRWVDAASAVVEVEAPAPSIVLVRNAWDPGWTATVDGRPAEVLRAAYLFQGIPVEAGRHRIELRFRDPWVWRGAMTSLVVLALLVVAAIGLRRRERELTGSGAGPPPEDPG